MDRGIAMMRRVNELLLFVLIFSGSVIAEEAVDENPAKLQVREIGKGMFQVGEITIDAGKKEITFAGEINMSGEENLEYVLVNEDGEKMHESLLSTKIRPIDLNVAMLLCFKPSPEFIPSDEIRSKQKEEGRLGDPEKLPERKVPANAVIEMEVTYENAKGRSVTVPVEKLIWNAQSQSTEKGRAWVYTGSRVIEGVGFHAQVTGCIMALMEDRDSMINNPRPEATTYDDIWYPLQDAEAMPAEGTTVQITIRSHRVVENNTKKTVSETLHR